MLFISTLFFIEPCNKAVCTNCQAGPCTRWCSRANWCGKSDLHKKGTDCTGCGKNTSRFILMRVKVRLQKFYIKHVIHLKRNDILILSLQPNNNTSYNSTNNNDNC